MAKGITNMEAMGDWRPDTYSTNRNKEYDESRANQHDSDRPRGKACGAVMAFDDPVPVVTVGDPLHELLSKYDYQHA